MEALAALEELGIPTADYGLLLERFQEHAESLRQRQDQTEGGWNNILTNPDTFLETSCGAMFLTGFIKGGFEFRVTALLQVFIQCGLLRR